MEYFTIKRFLFLVPSNDCNEELEKIDKFINLLNKSGIGKIIEKEQKEKGISGYNPFDSSSYNMLLFLITQSRYLFMALFKN